MVIKPSAAIRNDYAGISKICKTTGEPVYLTKNGEGDLVVMDIEAYENKVKELETASNLLQIREGRLAGAKGYSIEEFEEIISTTLEKSRGVND